jgi:hypothetical protein
MSLTPIQILQYDYSAMSLVTRHISSQRITHVSQYRPDRWHIILLLARFRLLHTYYERPKNVTLFGFAHVPRTLANDVKTHVFQTSSRPKWFTGYANLIW